MLAIGVIAVGMAGLSAAWQAGATVTTVDETSPMLGVLRISQREKPWFEQGGDGVNLAAVLAAYLILACRLIMPRPPLARVFRQWGAVAVLGVVVANLFALLTTNAVALFRLRIHGQLPFPGTLGEQVWLGLRSDAAPAVILVSWLVLRVTRLGRSEPGWIDRSGRWVGWFWLASALYRPFLPWLTQP